MRVTLFGLICFCLLFTSCKESKPGGQLPPVKVTVATVKPQTVPNDFEYIGVAESSHPVQIRARVEGYLNQIAYKEGSFVKEGDLLFVIDPRPFQASLDRAQSELARAKAVLWNATQARERLEPLYKQKAASLRDLDNAIASEQAASANVEAMQAQVVQAQLNLSYTSITTPVSGLSSFSSFREGSLITPNVNGLLTTISVVDPIWVNFSVSERDIIKARSEQQKKLLVMPGEGKYEVELTLSDGTVYPTKGTIDFAAPTLQVSTGTMLVRSVFANPEAIIKPGQFLRARIIGAVRPNAIVVPQTAVMQGRKGMYVYTVNSDNKVEIRYVQTGGWVKDEWVIGSGLLEGDRVIVEGNSKVQVGQVVEPELKNPSPNPGPAQ